MLIEGLFVVFIIITLPLISFIIPSVEMHPSVIKYWQMEGGEDALWVKSTVVLEQFEWM